MVSQLQDVFFQWRIYDMLHYLAMVTLKEIIKTCSLKVPWYSCRVQALLYGTKMFSYLDGSVLQRILIQSDGWTLSVPTC